MIDAFGNTLRPGDYFSYAAQSYRRVGQRIGRVPATGERLKIAERYGRTWNLMTNGRPNDSVTRIPAEDIPDALKGLLA